MKFFHLLIDLFKHLNESYAWKNLIEFVGPHNIYVVLFLIIFAETGLVILPFLPGDSLLFAIGAISSKGDVGLNIPLITVLLIVAAVVGDAVNYWIGYRLGPKVFTADDEEFANVFGDGKGIDYATPKRKQSLKSRLLNKHHLLKAQAFYEKYGAKTIILARFVPIVRTFAPFVAGIGKMNYLKFALYNIVGGIAWVCICIFAGVYFGQFEFVKKRFELVILAIIAISVLPVVIEVLKARADAKRAALGDAPGKP